jgi:hypothetical protein
MSQTLFEFARSFATGRLTPDEFANAYIELWKIERDQNILRLDHTALSECLSTIFCLADLYYPESSREEYELNGEQLRARVQEMIDKLSHYEPP